MAKAKTAAKAAAKAKKSTKPKDEMKVVESRLEGGRLFVVVEGTNLERLMSSAARALAYDHRLEHGFSNAGIEPRGGTYIDDSERSQAQLEERPIQRWRREFTLTQML